MLRFDAHGTPVVSWPVSSTALHLEAVDDGVIVAHGRPDIVLGRTELPHGTRDRQVTRYSNLGRVVWSRRIVGDIFDTAMDAHRVLYLLRYPRAGTRAQILRLSLDGTDLDQWPRWYTAFLPVVPFH